MINRAALAGQSVFTNHKGGASALSQQRPEFRHSPPDLLLCGLPNEGNAAALAAGYHLATGKTAVVYLQNSGEGNLINPLASLLHRYVSVVETITSPPAAWTMRWITASRFIS